MTIRRSLALGPVFASMIGMGALTLSTPARACGGTFCDNVVLPMPVDQTGEDILFIREGTEIEVHIRIAYEGEPERFAWLVPLQAVPTVSVGSEPLFRQLAATAAPNWQAVRHYECPEDDPNANGSLSFIMQADIPDEGGPDVVFQQVVGSFEVVVLEGGTAAEVIDFLQANDYLQDPESEPILQEYIDEGFLFAAVKLIGGVGVDAIHPLVFRMQAEEPCVPIRLTRIAAEQDMGIRVYFLGQDRWAPSNYAHVVVNPLAYDWQASEGLPRYVELLSLAVDEAGGHAFATDHAGPSNDVSTFGVYAESWDEELFVDADPILAMDLLRGMGLDQHPLIQSLLLQFIPPPDGVVALDFWNNLEDYADQIDLTAWDGPAFAAALSERIIEPGLHAVELLETWPKLTRLHTTMSPAEMTVDPTFHPNPDLADVSSSMFGYTQVECNGDEVYGLEVENTPAPVCVPLFDSWPKIAGMPVALKIEQIPMAGPPQVLDDQTETALALLAAQQATAHCASTGDTGDGGLDEFGDGLEGESGPGPIPPSPHATCGCSTASDEAPLAIGLGLLVLGFIVPRRRRS